MSRNRPAATGRVLIDTIAGLLPGMNLNKQLDYIIFGSTLEIGVIFVPFFKGDDVVSIQKREYTKKDSEVSKWYYASVWNPVTKKLVLGKMREKRKEAV